LGRDGSNPAAPFCHHRSGQQSLALIRGGRRPEAIDPRLRRSSAPFSFESLRSKSARVDRPRTRAAAIFDDSFATIAGRAAMIAVTARHVVKITGLKGCSSPGGIADDRGWFA